MVKGRLTASGSLFFTPSYYNTELPLSIRSRCRLPVAGDIDVHASGHLVSQLNKFIAHEPGIFSLHAFRFRIIRPFGSPLASEVIPQLHVVALCHLAGKPGVQKVLRLFFYLDLNAGDVGNASENRALDSVSGTLPGCAGIAPDTVGGIDVPGVLPIDIGA